MNEAPPREELDRRIAATRHLGVETKGAASAADLKRHTVNEAADIASGRIRIAGRARIYNLGISPADEESEPPQLRLVKNPFPLEALPPVAAEYAWKLTENGIPSEYSGPAMLAVLACAVGGRVKLEVNEGMWPERAALWIALVGESGSLKSPAIGAVRTPLDDLERPKFEKFRQDISAWKDLSRADQQRTPKPVLSRLSVSDSTIEALARTLQDNPGGLVLISDELTALVKGLGQYKKGGGNDRAHFLETWSGSPIIIDRVGGDLIYVSEPTLSVLGGIQPGMLKNLDGEDGLPGRWLYSNGPADGEADVELAFRSLHKEAADWSALVRATMRARHIARTVTLSADARERFRTIHKRTDKVRRQETGHLRQWAAKGGSHFLRLALVLSEATQPAAGNITNDALDHAEMLLDYFAEQVRQLPVRQQNLMAKPWERDHDAAVDQLDEWLRRQPHHSASRREVQRARVAGVRTPAEVNALLDRFEATYPRHVVEETRGRQSSMMVYASDCEGD